MTRACAWIVVALVAGFAGIAPPPVEARIRPPASGPVVLVGEIRVGGDHGGVLELYLDGKRHAAVPAGNGAFEIAMPRDGNAGMVSLEFTAPALRLRSLVGGQQRLARRAGTAGRLSVEDEDRLRLTPLGTAIAVVAARPDGVPPASDRALADAVQATTPDHIVRVAAAIERLALDPARLPDGVPDGLALTEDPAAFDSAVRADPGLVSDPHLVFDALPSMPLALRDVGDVLIFANRRGASGTPSSGPGLVIEREPGGFRLHDHQFDGPSWLGRLDHLGSLLLEPMGTVAGFAGYQHCRSIDLDVGLFVYTLQRDLRRLWSGSGLSLWQYSSDSELRSPQCPGFQPVARRGVGLMVAPDIAQARLLTTPRRFLGRHSLPMFCGYPMPHGGIALEPCGQADHVFARDGSGVAHPPDGDALEFSWGQDGHGAIRVDYGDAGSRFWIIDAGDRVTQAVAYVAEGVVVGYPGTSSGHATLVRGGLPGAAEARRRHLRQRHAR